MSDPAPMATCPNGHASADRAYCTVCGTLIVGRALYSTDSTPTTAMSIPRQGATFVGPDAQAPPAGPPPAAKACPHCSAQLDEASRFCEVCGYDPLTDSLPQAPVVQPATAVPPSSLPYPAPAAAPAPAPAPGAGPAGGLVAVISADRAYYDSHDVGDVAFPLGAPVRAIELPAGPVNIGRRSRSRGTNPGIDLAGPPEDPAVSHSHASLLPGDDGSWTLVDHGSTNGTYLNEAPDPVPANRPLPVSPGDRIYVGAWTRITLERPRPA